MMKTPRGEDARRISNVHLELETLNQKQLCRKEASDDAHK